MKITSSVFVNNGKIPEKYTCVGEDVNPPLEISDVSEKANSLVLIVEDPDAPNGEGESGNSPYYHWIIYNMSPNIKFITEGIGPSNAKYAVNSFGRTEYGGPCPPKGNHRYIFRLYALDEMLDEMPDFTDKDMLIEAMHGHVIEQVELIGTFQK